MPDLTIGILHSLTGTMAFSERPLADAALFAVDEINAEGGVLGRRLRAVVEDGGSEPEQFAGKARKLCYQEETAALFGCWTSASRKAVLPLVETADTLLFYPVQYEGLEESRQVLYTGSCLNQQIAPAVGWILAQGWQRCLLIGSDYVFPRVANLLIKAIVNSSGGEVLRDELFPLGEQNFAGLIEQVKALRPEVIFNTLNGDSNFSFFRQLHQAGFHAAELPVMSFSLAEVEQQAIASEATGHFACWSYFQTLETPENEAFVARYRERFGPDRVISDPMVSAYSQVHLWRHAVQAAGSTDSETVLNHLCQLPFVGPAGKIEVLSNHHVRKLALIGQARPDGQFQIVWRSHRPIDPKPWLGIEKLDPPTLALAREALRQFPQSVHYAATLEAEISRRKATEKELKHLATHDTLTGLYNRHRLQQQISEDVAKAERHDFPLSVLMCDIDRFKPINDTYGHGTGDIVLRRFARLLKSLLRKMDYAARYGGEEFVIILPDTSFTQAEAVAERLCHRVAEHSFTIEDNKALRITASIGIATFPKHAQSWEDLMRVGDSAMYIAKKAGGNQVKTPVIPTSSKASR